MLSTINESVTELHPSSQDDDEVPKAARRPQTPHFPLLTPPSDVPRIPSKPGQRLEDFEDLGEIGRGQFGSVHKVRCKKSGALLVWKKLDYQRMSDKEKRQLQQEVQLLQTLTHRNVVRYLGKINDKDSAHIYLLMEYCDGGDLGQYLDHTVRKGFPLPEDTILLWLSQLVDALYYCHNLPSGKVYHRDIKPQNVLICDQYKRVKLGDFGLAKMLKPQQLMAQTHVGTPYYMSPEVLNRNQYDAKSDVWSLGCLIYEMATGRSPHCQATTLENLKTLVDKGTLEKLPSNYSKELYSLIVWMLAKNPAHRPSTADLKTTFAFRLGCFVGLAEITNKIIKRKKDAEQENKQLKAELQKANNDLSHLQSKVAQLEAQLARPPRTIRRPSTTDIVPEARARRTSQPPSSALRKAATSVASRYTTPSTSPMTQPETPSKVAAHFAKPLSWKTALTPTNRSLHRPHLSRFALESVFSGESKQHTPIRSRGVPRFDSPFSTPLKQAERLAEKLPRYKAQRRSEIRL